MKPSFNRLALAPAPVSTSTHRRWGDARRCDGDDERNAGDSGPTTPRPPRGLDIINGRRRRSNSCAIARADGAAARARVDEHGFSSATPARYPGAARGEPSPSTSLTRCSSRARSRARDFIVDYRPPVGIPHLARTSTTRPTRVDRIMAEIESIVTTARLRCDPRRASRVT